MVRPVSRRSLVGVADPRGTHRADLAMDVLTYGTAVLAIVVVTLLAVVR